MVQDGRTTTPLTGKRPVKIHITITDKQETCSRPKSDLLRVIKVEKGWEQLEYCRADGSTFPFKRRKKTHTRSAAAGDNAVRSAAVAPTAQAAEQLAEPLQRIEHPSALAESVHSGAECDASADGNAAQPEAADSLPAANTATPRPNTDVYSVPEPFAADAGAGVPATCNPAPAATPDAGASEQCTQHVQLLQQLPLLTTAEARMFADQADTVLAAAAENTAEVGDKQLLQQFAARLTLLIRAQVPAAVPALAVAQGASTAGESMAGPQLCSKAVMQELSVRKQMLQQQLQRMSMEEEQWLKLQQSTEQLTEQVCSAAVVSHNTAAENVDGDAGQDATLPGKLAQQQHELQQLLMTEVEVLCGVVEKYKILQENAEYWCRALQSKYHREKFKSLPSVDSPARLIRDIINLGAKKGQVDP